MFQFMFWVGRYIASNERHITIVAFLSVGQLRTDWDGEGSVGQGDMGLCEEVYRVLRIFVGK